MKFKEIKNNLRIIKRNKAMEKELVQALAYIRNNVILGRGNRISSELLMEELADISESLKPVFQDMAQYLHLCDKEKAANVLYDYLGTGISKDLGRFLAGWEDIPSEELLKTLEIYMENLRKMNLDRKAKEDEMISDLIYFPVVLNAMFVLFDFVYVAFFIEQQNLLNQMFF